VTKLTKFKVLFITCMAVLGIAALPAMAQAASPEWYVNGAKLTGSENVKTSGSNMKLEIEGVATIKCSTMTGTGLITAPRSDSGSISFTGCEVVGLSSVCSVHGVGNAVGTITPGALATELKLVAPSTVYDVFKPASGTTFVEIVIEGASCSVANTYPITGEVAGLGEPLGTEKVEQPLTFSKAISTAAGTALKAGKKNAYMISEAGNPPVNFLTGAHETQKFGAR